MPATEYTPATSGTLKLKGVTPSSKITKHKKKRPKPPDNNPNDKPSSSPKPSEQAEKPNEEEPKDHPSGETETEDLQPRHKTEAELRHEERRQRRLNDRLKREGTKTHKERVEELNRYLSNLSEHHDMPRIGPG